MFRISTVLIEISFGFLLRAVNIIYRQTPCRHASRLGGRVRAEKRGRVVRTRPYPSTTLLPAMRWVTNTKFPCTEYTIENTMETATRKTYAMTTVLTDRNKLKSRYYYFYYKIGVEITVFEISTKRHSYSNTYFHIPREYRDNR